MAHPVPLVRQDTGAVLAYVCLLCNTLHAPGHRLDGSAPDEDDVAHAKMLARECCCCPRCKVVPDQMPDGDEHCAACAPIVAQQQAAHMAEAAKKSRADHEKQHAALSLAKDRNAALRIVYLLRELSESRWCSGWILGHEHIVWREITAPRLVPGHPNEVAMLSELRDLRDVAGGWWRWEDGVGEMFVPMAEWLQLVAAEDARRAGQAAPPGA